MNEMPWQEVVRHISDQRIMVRSKSGNEYPVATEYDRIGQDVYERLGNINATQHLRDEDEERKVWGWVDFDGDDPELQYLSSGSPTGGPPEQPPWER